jgi:hypothetical protein
VVKMPKTIAILHVMHVAGFVPCGLVQQSWSCRSCLAQCITKTGRGLLWSWARGAARPRSQPLTSLLCWRVARVC